VNFLNRVLITGAGGQLGRVLAATRPADIDCHALPREALDVGDRGQVEEVVAELRPDLVINAAAYTDVDGAEDDPEAAARVNRDGPANIAGALARGRGRMIQISTDYVFSGQRRRPWAPADRTDPVNVYGRTKLEGERAALARLHHRLMVLRTAWLYAPEGRNFVTGVVERLRTGETVRAVGDQTGAPTACRSVAEVVWQAARSPHASGVLHWTDDGAVTRVEWAQAIRADAIELGLVGVDAPDIEPITAEALGLRASRPGYSVLDLSATRRLLTVVPRPWRRALRECLERMPAGAAV
jgi:dTDP-4-dehydrorhamnose reductase